jgi:hypothetical protein
VAEETVNNTIENSTDASLNTSHTTYFWGDGLGPSRGSPCQYRGNSGNRSQTQARFYATYTATLHTIQTHTFTWPTS